MSQIIPNDIKYLAKYYYNITDKINQLQEELNRLKELKTTVEHQLITKLDNHQLADQAILYKNKKIYMARENNYSQLSYKFLEECLKKIYPYPDQTQKIKEIIVFIKRQRQCTKKVCIKISPSAK